MNSAVRVRESRDSFYAAIAVGVLTAGFVAIVWIVLL
jgi:hypothetical protein